MKGGNDMEKVKASMIFRENSLITKIATLVGWLKKKENIEKEDS